MKTIIKESLKTLFEDKPVLVLLSFLIFLSIIFSIIISVSINSSELQLVSHYSAYGITHLYRDQWFYLIVFVLFEIVVATLHSLISIKLLVTKGRSLAIMFAWFGIGILFFGLITAEAVLNVWNPL